MSDSIFNSFVNNVYGSGGSMQVFDQHIDHFEVVGGADDITVASIFGGEDKPAHDYSADYSSEEEKEDEKEQEESPNMVSSMSISFEADGDGEELSDVAEEPHKKNDSIIDELNIIIDEPCEPAKGGDISAFDISKLIAEYK